MHTSHNFCEKPSSLLTLLCLTVVHRLHPEYLAVSLSQAALSENVSPQRLSRLCSRAMGLFEDIVQQLVIRGRPPLHAQRQQENQANELAIVSSLLQVASQILAQVSLRKPAVRQLIVGAYLSLKAEHPSLSQKRFCQSLSLCQRTLRYWLRRTDTKQQAQPLIEPDDSQKRKRKRPPRRTRFGFDVILPSTQFAGDTTDLSAFCIPLKLIASQDIGGRDQQLFTSVLIDDHESALLVSKVLTDTLQDLPGAQFVSDQGTPYLAEHTQKVLEQLQSEHAPQREADPLGKATIERAFGSVKTILSPLLDISNQVAAKIPQLARADLAKAFVTVLTTALLKAYQAGARAAIRADEQRCQISIEQLEKASLLSRDNARAEDRSVRLTLERIHEAYNINGPRQNFIRQLRRYPLNVLHETEKAFGSQVHRDDIRDRKSYFCAIVRRKFDEHKREQQRIAFERKRQQKFEQQQREYSIQQKRWHQDPARWLRDALDALTCHWLVHKKKLLFGGTGIGLVWIREALQRIVKIHGTAAHNIATGVFNDFRNAQLDHLGIEGIQAIEDIVSPYFDKLPKLDPTLGLPAAFLSDIYQNNGSLPHPQPP